MEYKGKLYGKIGGMYFDTSKTSEDWDNLENKVKELQEAVNKIYLLLLHRVSSSDEPENCPKEYDENMCDGCEFRKYELVGHPGGGCDNRVSVEKAWCDLGHWEDDF